MAGAERRVALNRRYSRRGLLAAGVSLAAAGVLMPHPGIARGEATAQDRLAAVEAAAGGRLGVAARDTGTGATLRYRAEERFAFCSTFKILPAAAILRRSAVASGFLQQRIAYAAKDVVANSPITAKHVRDGMTVAEICAAALQYSDNTAANLMLWLLGGPQAVTVFARSLGDRVFRLDRWEPGLNNATPGDPRDTTTPLAMMRDLQRVTVGDGLGGAQRAQLITWLRGNTTGEKRVRAGVPAAWPVADKTGTGDYGTTNDVALIMPPGRSPIVLVGYFTQRDGAAAPRDDVIAAAARIAVAFFGGAETGHG